MSSATATQVITVLSPLMAIHLANLRLGQPMPCEGNWVVSSRRWWDTYKVSMIVRVGFSAPAIQPYRIKNKYCNNFIDERIDNYYSFFYYVQVLYHFVRNEKQPQLSKTRVFFLNLSWFGMNVMYLILSVEGMNELLTYIMLFIFPILQFVQYPGFNSKYWPYLIGSP